MKNKKSYRLQSKLMTYFFSLIMIIVIMLDIFFIYKMSEIVEKDTHVYAYEIVKQLGRNIESYIDHMQEVMWMISSQDTSLINQLKEPLNQKAVRKSYFLEEMRNRGSSNGVVSINIFGENGLVLTDSASNAIKDYIDVKQMEWYTKAVEAQGKPVICLLYTSPSPRDTR